MGIPAALSRANEGRGSAAARRGPQGLPVPHRARAQRHRALRQTDEPAGRLAHDPPPRGRGRHRGRNWLPHVPRGLPLTSRTAARSSMRRKWRRTRARARPSSTTAPRNGSPKTKWKGLGCKPTHWLRHRAGRPGRVRGAQLEFQFGAVFSKSVFLQKNRSTLQPGKHVFDGSDSPGLIALG